jgi:hypothetical protein
MKLRHFRDDQLAAASRRDFLATTGGGFGALALSGMLAWEGLDVDGTQAAESSGADAARRSGSHHPAKAKQVIQLFMNGGASPVDTFDYKPELAKRHGEKIDFGIKAAATSVPGAIMKSPFPFRQHGESGRWVSSVFPHVATIVDDLAFLMAMTTKTNVHGPASYMQNTGFTQPGFPCFGAWVSYGLGRLCDNLPTFVVLPDARGLPYNNAGNFSSAFLPMEHQGTILKPNAPTPINDLFPPPSARFITRDSEAAGLQVLAELNRDHARSRPGDARLESRIASYELAAKMQLAAPEALDLTKESAATHRAYGTATAPTADFAKSCLTARRLIERGVRFVQVWSGMGGPSNNWDNHTNIDKELPFIASMVDQPIAALIRDLKQRGMLDETLVIWTTEFGRMPFTQGATGRDHNGGTFVTWLAGGGIKPGTTHGESDEFAYKTARDETWSYDLHATALHLLGIDHTRLSVRHNGIDRRLTDVHGHVIEDILA